MDKKAIAEIRKLMTMNNCRIDKIRDILGLDFDSSDVRLRLLLSFKILEHLGRIRLDEFLEDEPSGSVASIE